MGVTRVAEVARRGMTTSIRGLALRSLLGAFPGSTVPSWTLRLVEEGLGGIALFSYNIVDLEQVGRLTATLRRARPDVIVATDEEGGDVTRLCYSTGSPYPGNAALGIVDDLDLTSRIYRSIGAELAAVGITLDMAPVVDVNSADDNPAIGTRSFGNDAVKVAAHAAAAVTGLQSAGVSACAKHFPGHGATEADSHLGLPVVDAPLEQLWQRELPPFEAAIKAGVRSVMTAHIRVPALSGGLPATFSPDVLTGLLRTELGFTGAVVSDALEMQGASGAIGVPEAAVRALVAGNDLLCIGGEFAKSPDAEALIEATVDAIVAAVHSGRLTVEVLEVAAARTVLLGRTPPVARSEDVSDDAVAAARRALRVEGALPAGVADALIVQLEPEATIAVGQVPWGLALHHDVVKLSEPSNVDDAVADLTRQARGRPIVVVSRDTHRHAWARALVERLPDVVLVEMGWPASWRPARARAYVASYGASRANASAVAELLSS
jgi:beta-N-acetylhexosaminidase